jgi:hypothetical protein
MTWNEINLYQYQQIIEANKIEYPIDRIDRLIGIINNWTTNQVNDLTVERYNAEVKRLAFLDSEPEGKPVKFINVNGKRYKCIYDVRQMPSARYIESKVFQTDLIPNLHKLAASMVKPMKKTIWGWKEMPFDSTSHSVYADDMLEAKFVDIYHSIVFFYHVYRIWIEVSRGYLKTQLEMQGTNQSEKALQDLLNIMDGNIAPHKLQNTIVSRLTKHMNFRP